MWGANTLLTVAMVNSEALRLMTYFPRDDSDGLFSVKAEVDVTADALTKSLDDFNHDHLLPALFDAWLQRMPPDTDRAMTLPSHCECHISAYQDFEARTIRTYRTATDHDVLMIEIRRGAWH